MQICLLPPKNAERDIHSTELLAEALFRPSEDPYEPNPFILLAHLYSDPRYASDENILIIPSADGMTEGYSLEGWSALEPRILRAKFGIIAGIVPREKAYRFNLFIHQKLSESDADFHEGYPALSLFQISDVISTLVSNETDIKNLIAFFKSIAEDSNFTYAHQVFDSICAGNELIGIRYK